MRGKNNLNQKRTMAASRPGAFLPTVKIGKDKQLMLAQNNFKVENTINFWLLKQMRKNVNLATIMIAMRANENTLDEQQISQLKELWELHQAMKIKAVDLTPTRMHVSIDNHNRITVTGVKDVTPTGGGISEEMKYKYNLDDGSIGSSITRSAPSYKMQYNQFTRIEESKTLLQVAMPKDTRDTTQRIKLKIAFEDLLNLSNYNWQENLVDEPSNLLHREMRKLLNLTPDQALEYCDREYQAQFKR